MTRQQRQLDELRALCAEGRVGRAVDLAFEHFARFGSDDDVLAMLLDAVDHDEAAPLRSKLSQLAAQQRVARTSPRPPQV
jgi:hypothetical protein